MASRILVNRLIAFVPASYHLRRQRLQAVGTKNSRRRLRQLSGRQSKFQKDTNHRIAKQLVAGAKHTKRLIALEDLMGIRERARVRGKARLRLVEELPESGSKVATPAATQDGRTSGSMVLPAPPTNRCPCAFCAV